MKNKIAKGLIVAASFVALAPMFAFADYSTSTAITSVNTLISDVGGVIAATVVTILALLAALMGLGWGVKKFRKYITGKSF